MYIYVGGDKERQGETMIYRVRQRDILQGETKRYRVRKKEICYGGVYIDQRESGESDDKPGEGGGGGGGNSYKEIKMRKEK